MSPPSSNDAPLADDDLLLLDDEPPAGGAPSEASTAPADASSRALSWRVLVVDDEPDVLLMTKLALQGLTVDGVPLSLTMVGSAAEARRVITETPDIAVAIVDVVMEDLTAGLDLVRWIREKHGDPAMRLVLRTGQPGHTPEAQVTAQYDIHDYLGKAETTARRLMTCVVGSVRAWRDIWTIRRQREGLQRALGAVGQLFDTPGFRELLGAILEQVTGLLLPRRSSLLLVGFGGKRAAGAATPTVLAATGRFAGSIGRSVDDVLPRELIDQLAPQLPRSGSLRVGGLVGYAFESTDDARPVLLIDGGPLQPWEQELIELYCHSVSLALRNRALWEQQLSWFHAMERFVPRELTSLLGKDDLREIRAGDSRSQAMTVCFVDVRQFSPLVAREGSDRAFRVLNALFQDLGGVVARRRGVIDKYLGDGALILFPQAHGDALQAAVDMQVRCEALRQAVGPGEPRLHIGVGLHCGEIIVGAVGHEARTDISVVSQVVNVTSRLQEIARNFACDIVLSDELLSNLGAAAPAAVRPILLHDLRGADRPLVLWECLDHLPEPERARRSATREPLEAATRRSQAGDWKGAAERLAEIASSDETCRLLHAWALEQAARAA